VTEGQSDQSVKDIFSVVVVTEAPQGLDIFSHASADLFSRPPLAEIFSASCASDKRRHDFLYWWS
jgi:hypothetical protein